MLNYSKYRDCYYFKLHFFDNTYFVSLRRATSRARRYIEYLRRVSIKGMNSLQNYFFYFSNFVISLTKYILLFIL